MIGKFLFAVVVPFVLFSAIRADKCRQPVTYPLTTTCGPNQSIDNEGGNCLCCWTDDDGTPKIGVNFNLKQRNAGKILAKYGLDLGDVLADCANQTTKACLSQSQAEDIFQKNSYSDAESCADAYAPGLGDGPLRAAVVDVALSMGCRELTKLKKFQKALVANDWSEAARVLQTYKWCADHAGRCANDVACLTGSNCVTGECNEYDVLCSSNSDCSCFATWDGGSYCATSQDCIDIYSCEECPSDRPVCVTETCCDSGFSCKSVESSADCKSPPESKSLLDRVFGIRGKRAKKACVSDNECAGHGMTCKHHETGRFCA